MQSLKLPAATNLTMPSVRMERRVIDKSIKIVVCDIWMSTKKKIHDGRGQH